MSTLTIEPKREQEGPRSRPSWNLGLLTRAEPGRRNRRAGDAVLLAAAALVLALGAMIAGAASAEDGRVERALVTLLGWAPTIWRLAFGGALCLGVVIVAAALLGRRWELVRDVALAQVIVALLGSVLGWAVDGDWLPVEAGLWTRWGFPDMRLAALTAVVVVAGPELAVAVRLVAIWLVPVAALGTVGLGASSPASAVSGLALGVGAAALVRVAYGSAAAMPPTERVRDALGALGIAVGDLRIAVRQNIGAAEYVGHDSAGNPLSVRVLGRDAQDTQRLARRLRLLLYRDPPRSAPVGRLEQVEHEALAMLMADRAGARVSEVVTAGLGPGGDAVLVTRRPDVDPLELWSADRVSDDVLRELWRHVARLHEAGISHGRLNLGNVVVDDEGPMLIGLSAATLGAPRSALDLDVAELLVSTCVLVGSARALSVAVDAGWGGAIARVLPYLQRAALTPHTRDLARAHELALDELRRAAAAAAGTKAPELVPLRRVRPKDVLTTVAAVFAAYLVITQLAAIGFHTIVGELGKAEPAWLVVALVLAQLALVGSGISVRGAVQAPLPLLPSVVLQSAIKFVNLTVPTSAGRIGMTLRFFQRMGLPRAQAVAAGAVDDLAETAVQAALLLLTFVVVGPDVDASQFRGTGPDTRLLVGIGAALFVGVLGVLFVPRVRAKVVPGLRSALSGLWGVARDRGKRVQLFGGNIASELLYALALGATSLAYGVDLSLAQLVFVNTSASVLSSVVPVPGGIGAAEAAIAAGLIAMGVDEPTAFAIAITHRLGTFYLPPIWGYFSLRWLSRMAYV